MIYKKKVKRKPTKAQKAALKKGREIRQANLERIREEKEKKERERKNAKD